MPHASIMPWLTVVAENFSACAPVHCGNCNCGNCKVVYSEETLCTIQAAYTIYMNLLTYLINYKWQQA